MKTSESAIEMIKNFESPNGPKLKSYLCPSNKLTIGWGHTGDDVYAGLEITNKEAEDLLRGDLSNAEDIVNRLVKAELNQNQFDALVSFVFNVGEGQFSNSTLLYKLNFGNYGAVPDELKRWNKGGRPLKILPGLVNRRETEAALWAKTSNET